MSSQCIVILDALMSYSAMDINQRCQKLLSVVRYLKKASKKSTSLTSNNSIFGLIFEVALIHPFWVHIADNYLKRNLKITARYNKRQDWKIWKLRMKPSSLTLCCKSIGIRGICWKPPPKAEQFLPKFHRLVLGWVELIDAKGIDVTQSTWSWGCPM